MYIQYYYLIFNIKIKYDIVIFKFIISLIHISLIHISLYIFTLNSYLMYKDIYIYIYIYIDKL